MFLPRIGLFNFALAVYSPERPVNIFIGDMPCLLQLELTYSASLTIEELRERAPSISTFALLSTVRINSVDCKLWRLRIVATDGCLPFSVRSGEIGPFAKVP